MPAPQKPRPVTVEVTDGLGVVEVLGNGYASVLYLLGTPAWLHAVDNHGSVGQLAARAGVGAPRPAELDAMRDWLADPGLRVDRHTGAVRGFDPARLRPLLRLLTRGRYTVTPNTVSWREWHVATAGEKDFLSWYWPLHGDAAVATDAWPPRDEATVAAYRERIAKGVRPAAVVIAPEPGGVCYILDGHHKLAAYAAAKVRPLLIEISPAEPVALPRETFASLLAPRVRQECRHTLEFWRWGGPPPDGEPD